MSNNTSGSSTFTSAHTHTHTHTHTPVWNSTNTSIINNNANPSIINEINNGNIDGYNFWDHRHQNYINSPGPNNYRSEFMTHFPCTPEIWSTSAAPSSNEFYRSQSVMQNTRMSKSSSGSSSSKKTRRRVATLAQRRAANIRERRRMFNLNEAFDKLRRKVPTFAYEKRLSRIETLRLAITYISFMSELLNGNIIDTENTAAASVYHQHQGQREFIPYPPILHS